MSQTNYSIDLKAAKGTKLFKKFLQSKNKSNIHTNPSPNQNKQQEKLAISNNLNTYQKSPQVLEPNIHKITFQQSKPVHQQDGPGIVNQKYQNIPTFTFNQQQHPKINIQERKTQRIGDRSIQNPRRRQFQRDRYTEHKKIDNQSYQQPKTTNIVAYDFGSPQRTTPIITTDEPINPKKYNKLAEQYEELIQQISNQRKSHKIQNMRLQQQIQSLNKKVYELGSRQDDLILENRRLKQRNQSENKSRIQIEQSYRQLGYQVQQLKDMVDGNQQSINKKQQQISYLRRTNQDMKQQVKFLSAENDKLRDAVSVFQRQRGTVDREKQTKQMHIHQLRQKINSVINQNSILKDQIFHLTSKLYQIQQQNKTLKADLRRQGESFPMDYLYEKMQQSAYQPRIANQTRQNTNLTNQPSQNLQNQSFIQQDRSGKRGQFAKQRNQRRNRREYAKQQANMIVNNEKIVEKVPQSNISKKQFQEKLRRFQYLQDQVQKLKDSKAMNGAMRRQKITLQRQIQQIEEYLKSHSDS